MHHTFTARPATWARRALLATAALFTSVALAASAPPAVGTVAPGFKLQDQDGKVHQLADYKGKWVVLYFYPKDDTPGCTTQACEFRDDIFKFKRIGAVILGVSVDDVSSHKEFAAKHRLPFTLLADSTKSTATAYGVLRNYLTLEIASRQTFLIDPQGKIAVHYADVNPKENSKQVLADITRLQGAAK